MGGKGKERECQGRGQRILGMMVLMAMCIADEHR